jgi:outer membrane protein assembly factor BamB
VAADGRLFILARPRPGREACLCLDANTGQCLWRQEYPVSFKPPDPSAGRSPSSTPTVDGDRVYMLGLGGMFHCLAVADGRVLWKHDFAREYWGVKKDADQDDAWFPSCGAAASPLAVDGLVVVPVGGEKAGALTAFDRRTGTIVWKALPERSSYGSPLLTTLPGGQQLVGFTGVRMVGLRFSDQKLLWEYPFPAKFEQTVLTPVLWKDRVIFGGEKKPILALQLTE